MLVCVIEGVILNSSNSSQEFVSKFCNMDSPALVKGLTNFLTVDLKIDFVKFEIVTIHTPNATWNSQIHYPSKGKIAI